MLLNAAKSVDRNVVRFHVVFFRARVLVRDGLYDEQVCRALRDDHDRLLASPVR